MLQTAVNQQRARWGGKFSVSAHRATQAQVARFIRRNTDGVIAENYGKTRPPGDLRVALFPSKHSRVRIPSPALTAKKRGTPGLRLGGQHWKCILALKGQRTRSGPFAYTHPAHPIARCPGAFLSLIKTGIACQTRAGAARAQPHTYNRRPPLLEPAAQYHPNHSANSYSTCGGTAGESQSRRSRGSGTCLLNRGPPGW